MIPIRLYWEKKTITRLRLHGDRPLKTPYEIMSFIVSLCGVSKFAQFCEKVRATNEQKDRISETGKNNWKSIKNMKNSLDFQRRMLKKPTF